MRNRFVTLALVISTFALANSACFGKFELTRKLYQFNHDVHKDPYVRSAVMWVMILVPIYEIGAFLDFTFFNPIEFFTGSNPVTALDGKPMIVTDGSNRAVISRTENQIKIDFYEHDTCLGSIRVTQDEMGVVRAAGKLGSEGDFTATYQNGTFTISDKNGMETLSTDEVRARVEASGFTVPAL